MIGRRPCIKIIFGSAVNSNAKDATDFEIIILQNISQNLFSKINSIFKYYTPKLVQI